MINAGRASGSFSLEEIKIMSEMHLNATMGRSSAYLVRHQKYPVLAKKVAAMLKKAESTASLRRASKRATASGAVLDDIVRNGPSSPRQISSRTGVRTKTVSSALREHLRRGLVVRHGVRGRWDAANRLAS